jgi:hypothetical protein
MRSSTASLAQEVRIASTSMVASARTCCLAVSDVNHSWASFRASAYCWRLPRARIAQGAEELPKSGE